jgi:hypothetical protein
LDFIKGFIAVLGERRKGSVFNDFMAVDRWFNASPIERLSFRRGCMV